MNFFSFVGPHTHELTTYSAKGIRPNFVVAIVGFTKSAYEHDVET